MTCARHNLRVAGLVLGGRMLSSTHAEVLTEIHRCPRCTPVTDPGHRLRVPRPRAENAPSRPGLRPSILPTTR